MCLRAEDFKPNAISENNRVDFVDLQDVGDVAAKMVTQRSISNVDNVTLPLHHDDKILAVWMANDLCCTADPWLEIADPRCAIVKDKADHKSFMMGPKTRSGERESFWTIRRQAR
jgi:hypothetical protein